MQFLRVALHGGNVYAGLEVCDCCVVGFAVVVVEPAALADFGTQLVGAGLQQFAQMLALRSGDGGNGGLLAWRLLSH